MQPPDRQGSVLSCTVKTQDDVDDKYILLETRTHDKNISTLVRLARKLIFLDLREYKWECRREVEHAGDAFDDSHPDADFRMMPSLGM